MTDLLLLPFYESLTFLAIFFVTRLTTDSTNRANCFRSRYLFRTS